MTPGQGLIEALEPANFKSRLRRQKTRFLANLNGIALATKYLNANGMMSPV